MRINRLSTAILLMSAWTPALHAQTTLFGGRGGIWDFNHATGGVTSGGCVTGLTAPMFASREIPGGFVLYVDGRIFTTAPADPELDIPNPVIEDGGQTLVFGPVDFGDVAVTRRVFVPLVDQNYVRYVECFTNNGPDPVTIDVTIGGGFGAGEGQLVFCDDDAGGAVSDRDRFWSVADAEYVQDQPTASGVLGLVTQDGLGTDRPLFQFSAQDDLVEIWEIGYRLALESGETACLMHFGIQVCDEPDQYLLNLDASCSWTQTLLSQPDVDHLPAENICNLRNWRPIRAEAGTSRSVVEGGPVTLGTNASGLGLLTFEWQQTEGPDVTLDTTDPARPTFTAPTPAARTALTFELTATAGQDECQIKDKIEILVVPCVASAGSDRTANEGNTLFLDAGASLGLGNLSYEWFQSGGLDVSILGPDSPTPSFVAPQVDTDLILRFTVIVTSDRGCSDMDEVEVRINDLGSGAGAAPLCGTIGTSAALLLAIGFPTLVTIVRRR
jgi:hypothetical protein